MNNIYWSLFTDKDDNIQTSLAKISQKKPIKSQRLLKCKINLHYIVNENDQLINTDPESHIDINLNSTNDEERRDIPLLKSALQKCVRRGYTNQAVNISYQLMKRSLAIFLRRIVIITIEDSHWNDAISVIVWLRSYFEKSQSISKYLNLSIITKWLLGYVAYICNDNKVPENWSCNWSLYEQHNKRNWLTLFKEKYFITNNDNSVFSLKINLIFSLMLYDERTIYYLSFDKPMVCATIQGIIDGDNNDIEIPSINYINIDFNKLNYQQQRDIPLEAIDFHINNDICETSQIKLKEYDIELNEEEIKKILWIKRSGYNKRYQRASMDDLSEKAWIHLEKIFNILSSYIVK